MTPYDPLPVVAVNLRGGKKNRTTIISGLTCLWDRGATNCTIKRKRAKPYKIRIVYNKVEHTTSAGPFYTTHETEVPFSMT